MQFTVCGFQQMRLCELGLDSIDVIILRWFIDFYHTDKMEKTQDGAWVKYSYVIKSLPILGFRDKQTIAYRFDKMVQAGLLNKTIDKKDGKIKARFLLNPVEYSKLIEQPIRSEQYTLYGDDRIPYTVQTVYIDSSNNDSSNKDNKPPISPTNENQNSVGITANVVCENYTNGDFDNFQKVKSDHSPTKIAAGDVIKINGLTGGESISDNKDYREPLKKHKVTSKKLCPTGENSTIISKENDDSTPEHRRALQSPTEDVQLIFNHWCLVMNHPQSKLDGKRVKCIKNALKIGYSVEELKQAIDGCAKTPFNMGVNDSGQRYDSIELILRNADKIDHFIQNCINPPQAQKKTQNLPPWEIKKQEEIKELAEKRKRADAARIALEKRRRAEEEELNRTKSERAKSYIENHSSKIKQVLDDAVKAIKINPWNTRSKSGGLIPKS